MRVLEKLEPERVFYYFEEISRIPRGSGNEKAISDYLAQFAKDHGLACIQDQALNILIKKEGTPGYELSPTVILQGHMDMVCEKNGDTEHDFLTDPLTLKVEGDYITADGTTLGADDGIAVAYCLTLLEATDIPHPPLEVLITTDEEVGMNGARNFDGNLLTGRKLINLDTEEEGQLLVSCCGGMRATIALPIVREAAPKIGYLPYVLRVKGLKGGHSGSDIHLQRANANKLMGRVLDGIGRLYSFRLASLDGGKMDNAISREADCVMLLKKEDAEGVRKIVAQLQETFRHEYQLSDPQITLTLEPLNETVEKVFSQETAEKAVAILLLIPYGVVTWSLAMKGLVESSSNIGIVKTGETELYFESAVRSSVLSRKYVIYDQIRQIGFLTGANVTQKGEYPSWEYEPDSQLLKLFQEVYRDMYQKEPRIEAIHAGVECGLFGGKIQGLDMISIGPDMEGIHSPDERLSISSTKRVWEYLKEVLRRLK